MRSNPGTRPPVAKLIEESRNIKDSDILMQYIREITRFYSSEHKTSSEIMSQFKKDIDDIVQSYYMAQKMSGNIVGYEQYKVYGIDMPINKDFEKDMWGLSESLQLLMYETANMGLFLDDNSLLKLGLNNVMLNRPIEQMGKEWGKMGELIEEFGMEKGLEKFRRRYPKGTIKPSKILKSVYDCVIVYYKNHKPKDFPTPSSKVLEVFKFNKESFLDFCGKYYGKNMDDIASALLSQSNINLSFSGAKKAIFDYFVLPFLGELTEREESNAYRNFRNRLKPNKPE